MSGKIGKTRQRPKQEEVFDPEVGRARGMLRRGFPGDLRHVRRAPPRDLRPWIAHYWMIRWDLRGCAPQRVENLPHPNVHFIVEEDGAVVSGVQRRKFSRVIDGCSQVFGIKFRPGGFRPLLGKAVSTIADRTVPAERIFGPEAGRLCLMILAASRESDKMKAATAFLRRHLPKPDPNVSLADQLVNCILHEVEIKTVDDLVERAGMGRRSLQRLFSEYVGASPKWVIRRYRLHEVMERLNSGAALDWAQLAAELGYFDQAHLINDFKAIVGYSPAQYKKLAHASLQRIDN